MSAPPLPRTYTVKEVAEAAGVGIPTVYAWIRSGRLEALRLAGTRSYRIPEEAVTGLLQPVR